MATIDDIRIKLGVDASEVSRGIKTISQVMDTELRKSRVAKVTVTLSTDKADAALKELSAKIKEAGQVNVKVGLADFDAAPIAKQLTDDLKSLPGGGVKVPVVLDTGLTKKEQATTQRDLRSAIGTITVDWQLAPQPKGGWPQPPEGWGGAGGFGPPSHGGGPSGGGTGGGTPQPTAGGGGAETKAPRTAAQKANDERLRGAMSARKKAEAASDQEAFQKANDEVKRAEAERTRLAKERRAEQKGAAVPPADVQPEPETATGLGGRKAGQRAAKRAAKQAAAVPTGAPVQPRSGSPTQIAGTERPAVGRRGDPLANFVGKGKEEKFRRSAAPRDLLAAGRELTAEGQLRADMGMPIRAEDIAAEVKQGETPETVNPFSGVLRELGLSVQRKKGLIAFAGEYKAAGLGDVESMSEEDARAQLRALKPRQREELFRHLGLPSTVETAAGGALNPINDPKIIQAWQRLMLIPAARFNTAAEETAGGIVNVNAGARLKDPPSRVKSGGQITGGAIEQALKQASLPLEKRGRKQPSDKEEPWKQVPQPPVSKNRRAEMPDLETAARMSEIRGSTGRSDEERMFDLRSGLANALREPGAIAGPASPLSDRPAPRRTLADVAGPIPGTLGYPEPGYTTPSSYEAAYPRAIEKRFGLLRRAAGMPPLSIAERQRALEHARFSLAQREDLGLPRLTIPGLAEGGRIHHTQRWRQMSLRQRMFQPFCTYCGTFGTKDNPLQGEHINEIAAGGSPFDPRNVTTACKNCNLAKRGKVGWGPPGRAEGGELPDPQAYDPNEHDPDDWPLTRAQWNRAGRLSKYPVDLQWLMDESRDVRPSPHDPDADEAERHFDTVAARFLKGPGPGNYTVAAKLLEPGYSKRWHGYMPWSANAEGGEIKHTGLLGRMVSRGTYGGQLPPGFNVTQVGERGPELIVQGPNGEAEVVPTHQVPTWLARAQQGKGFGKDLTGRAEGGPLGSQPIRYRGDAGRFVTQGAAIAAAGPLAELSGGSIQRVFVVNWPGAFAGQGGSRPVRVTETTPSGTPLQLHAASEIQRPGRGPATRTPKGVLPTIEAVAQAQPTPGLLPSQDPFFRAQIDIAKQAQLVRGRGARQEERTQIAVALAENPVRAFTVAFSQVAQTLAGRGGLLQRAGAARVATQATQAAELRFANAQAELAIHKADRDVLSQRNDLGKKEIARLAQLDQLIPQEEKKVALFGDTARRLGDESEAATKGISSTGQAIRNLAVGGVSVIAAGVAFSATFAAFNAAFEVGAKTIGDATDRATNYSNATAALTEELAKGARASGSSAKAATAATLAASGLADETSKRVAPALAGRAQGVAGNQALQEQITQIAAAQNIGQGRPPGLPAGFDTSLVRSTGGPFNLGLLPGVLSDRSTSDLLRNSLNQVPGGGSQSLGGGAGPFRGQSAPGTFVGRGAGPGSGFLGVPPGSTIEKEQAKADRALSDWIKTVTERGQKGGALSRLVRETDQARIDATIRAFQAVGADDLAQSLQARADKGQGLALTGAISDFLAGQFLQAQQQAGLRPSVGNVVTQLTTPIGGLAPEQGGLNQLDVQLRDTARRAEFQRGTVLPAQQALAFANQPLVKFPTLPDGDKRLLPSGPLPGKAFADTENTVGQYQAAFEKYAKFAEPAQAKINDLVEKGRKTLQSWIGPELLGDITSLGKNIQDIQLGLSQRSLNLEVSQYNNEIRIATRQLGIAQDFTKAIKGNVKDTIGGLQGQNFQLGRQLQLLQQELQQRQINLQLALAGFQSPGETSAERSARRADAEAQAKIAQQQLDLQKKLSGNEFTVGLKENANAITDLTAQIALLREGKSFAIDSFAAQEAIKNMEAELQALDQEAQSRFDQQVTNEQTLLGIWHDIEAATGQAIDLRDKEFVNLVTAFQKAGKAAGQAAVDFVMAATFAAATATFPNGDTGDAGSRPGTGSTGDAGDAGLRNTTGASGLLFDTTGPTNMTVGEAGTETVAVLRNPKRVEMAGASGGGYGGGGTTVNVIFNNPVVRDDADINLIVRRVEDALNRRTQLVGLR